MIQNSSNRLGGIPNCIRSGTKVWGGHFGLSADPDAYKYQEKAPMHRRSNCEVTLPSSASGGDRARDEGSRGSRAAHFMGVRRRHPAISAIALSAEAAELVVTQPTGSKRLNNRSFA